MSEKELLDTINGAITEVSQWRRSIFYLPTGHVGEKFIDLLAKIYAHFHTESAFEPIALTMAAIAFPLLLQKTSKISKCKGHI